MPFAPIVLVPGFWLGAWAWDEVADLLRADGHAVSAITLPGLDGAAGADRDSVTFDDHVAAICDAATSAPAPVVLAVHSGAGAPGYAASDRVADRIARMVYVDSGPATGPLDADFEGDEWALPPWDELDENLDGITEAQLETFRERAVPEPASAIRGAAALENEARFDIPSIVICTSFPSDVIKAAVAEGQNWIAGLAELRDVTYVDLPTSHWPMWSRPQDIADILAEQAVAAGRHPESDRRSGTP